MIYLLFLILFPVVPALILLIVPNYKIRKIVVILSSVIVSAVSIYTAILYFSGKPVYFELDAEWVDKILFGIEMAISLLVVVLSIRHKKFIALILALMQAGLIVYFELTSAPAAHVSVNLYIDPLSIIMMLIVGIVGSMINIYALSYMKEYHAHHKEYADRGRFFFFLIFIFMSAMYGIIFSNNLMWLFFSWEVTTLCSFLLIGYTRTQEAADNSFRALIMNLLGGVAFIGAIIYLNNTLGILELDKLVASKESVVLLPAAMLCFAGITKSAQLPFSSWLLGAMVAPTPSSALLHSSTMVKAGVFIIIKLSPLIMGTITGNMVALVGGLTFLFGSFIAISQRNAKKVLAYSTIANLGLIVACAGLGTYETVWAAVFLIIFHAVAKSLLFLMVGTVEMKLHTKDIEHMSSLIVKMPRVAIMMVVGICGMFVAPFGMLISKWAALRAFIDLNNYMAPIMILFISFGGAATIFFWSKWMGTLLSINNAQMHEKLKETKIAWPEWVAGGALAVFNGLVCAVYPLISNYIVEPYVQNIYGKTFSMELNNIIIMMVMIGMIIILPVMLLLMQGNKRYRYRDIYMSGRNVTINQRFDGSIGTKKELKLNNYYMEKYFGENTLLKTGVALALAANIVMIAGFR
ncbi:MAG: NADH-quinone oxidoreductase subunit L [Brevinematales bacterium]|nr:NADH-quinone oxidoreductase subunit L [Brevinematales bacterium]